MIKIKKHMKGDLLTKLIIYAVLDLIIGGLSYIYTEWDHNHQELMDIFWDKDTIRVVIPFLLVFGTNRITLIAVSAWAVLQWLNSD